MTAQIYKFPAEKREIDRLTFETVSFTCATLEAMYDAIRMMREAAEGMETSPAPLRADARTMVTRLATHLHEIEKAIMSSRNTARYCAAQLKEMGQ